MIKEKVKIAISAGVIILAGIIAVSTLLQEAPVVIQIEGESFKIIEIPYSYTTGEAYMLLTSGLFSGLALYQILISLNIHPFVNTESYSSINVPDCTSVEDQGETRTIPEIKPELFILMALEGDEKKIVKTIVDSDGQILQNELVNRLDFSKAKTSRILSNLEKKGIISKQKYGLTNSISLTEEIRGENK